MRHNVLRPARRERAKVDRRLLLSQPPIRQLRIAQSRVGAYPSVPPVMGLGDRSRRLRPVEAILRWRKGHHGLRLEPASRPRLARLLGRVEYPVLDVGTINLSR
jgi:hypothetical protein